MILMFSPRWVMTSARCLLEIFADDQEPGLINGLRWDIDQIRIIPQRLSLQKIYAMLLVVAAQLLRLLNLRAEEVLFLSFLVIFSSGFRFFIRPPATAHRVIVTLICLRFSQ